MELFNRNAISCIWRILISLFVVLALAGTLAAQQETGRVTGTIKDQTGAVIPNAEVTLRNIATNAPRATTSGPDGGYVVTNLLPGTCEVTVEMKGFNTLKKQVVIPVGGAVTLDFSLVVGATPTTVVVSEAAVAVNTETQTLANVITTRQVEELPTLTRNPYDLVGIAGNASPGDARDSTRGAGYALNGHRSASTNILLDGSDNNDTFTASVGQAVPLDSVQEFSVVSSAFTAEYGSASGGVVNVATKYENPQYAVINYRTADGFSQYHAMVADVRSQNLFNQGLQLELNWTWSHAIDNLSTTFSEDANTFNLGLLEPSNPNLDKGSADFDVRHRVALSAVWGIPYAKNTKGVANAILDGWSLVPIFNAHTGTPFTVFDCTNGYYMCNRMIISDAAGLKVTGSGSPAAVAGVPDYFNFIDLSSQSGGTGDNAYANPITGTADFGPYPSNMSGRNIFRQPGIWNMTLGIYKNFRLKGEGHSLQFRSEFYNLFNHANLYADVAAADISAASYVGALRGAAGERRNIQFALKFIF